MSGVALRAEGLGKRYRTGVLGAPNNRLSEAITSGARSLVRRGKRHGPVPDDYVWALRDVSLEVRQGEVVGIIGRNGAGKTTLLKILSGITEPSKGRIGVNGRVGSLLEVGTGFHPELTGRENIFLNGAILGMRRTEIRRKFDEIVEFAETGRYLDTPVKRYSSGMYVRLAFAVAAHLEPEILVVDEVLAVGDAAFQQKCVGKMGDVARNGLTVLFVSHNLGLVSSLCSRVIVIESGQKLEDSSTTEGIRRYLECVQSYQSTPLHDRTDRSGDGSARITDISFDALDEGSDINSLSRLRVTLSYQASAPLRHPRFVVSIDDHRHIGVFVLDSDATGSLPPLLPAEGTVTCITAPLMLTAGRCNVNVLLQRGGITADYVAHASSLEIRASETFGAGRAPGRDWALCLLEHTWSPGGVNAASPPF